ncbi:MAG: amino acid carrier protein [Allomuricauda sp.]|jgi:AGCS family alanine or glycine:cation symporter|uniref:amino acid carrier protein n=1 Tax=Flavobacteriaceae TaxID=49546 RepID=UPI0015C8CD6F|nr:MULTISPECIES: amino acid carrier protein [unclassified Allomuricauda]MBO6589358.1 amino acid carrier protein [Allomuricauda sp.]MBO6619210.1 amino acid carrier protein [Allomuricauda sp.]MBO6644895.1 amino acid carrier protein [Allomuricauda sp.]MBO6747330.1 amino acid carrier protein [Allomuricauda sp.]MBO6830254.1 amino acid carrier protein [Allomuricauda sp.]
MKYFLSLLSFFALTTGFAQELTVVGKTYNVSDNINDGAIELEVDGGVEPYTYKWSDQETPLTSKSAQGLVEGIAYTVVVTDAAGNSVTKEFTVETQSITEVFNGTMTPAVGGLGSVLFWDPFAAIGIYDPVAYADVKLIGIPDWSNETQDKFILKEWLKENRASVVEGEDVAIITSDKRGDITIQANAKGKLVQKVKQGNVIYNSENQEHVIEQGAHYFAEIEYDEPVAMLHPNGDPIIKGIPFIVIWLVFGALFFTLRMGFINIRGFKHSIDLAKGKYDDPDAPGQVTHFQALATAVSGTVGLGNIAGVAVAVSLGGAGATFWMIVCGLLGMSSKFVECTLGVKYRDILPDGRVFGGPMNYLRYGLEKRNLKGFGKVLAGVFALLAVGASFGGGNMFQANQSFEQLAGQFPVLAGNGFWFGVVTAILVGVVIIGGISSIAKVTGKIVPIMASIYIVAALAVIIMNIQNIGPAFSAIVDGAFSPSALKGGILGVLVIGFQRAAFSNEAGVGSAAIAHSAAKTNHPPSEGFVALLEPFIDTVVVCTLTALVLIFTGMHEVEGMAGAQLTSDAFGSQISWFPYVLALAVFLFAFSTMISWSYYGMRAWTYLFGKSKRSEMIYKMLFLVFVVVGASVSLGAVLDFSDMMILAMSFPNIIGLYIMSGEVRKDLDGYLTKLKAGQLFKKLKS